MAVIPWGAQLYMGRGLNSQTGAVYGNGLSFDPPQTNPGVGFQTDFTLESITSSRDLRSHLNVSATASFAGSWGASASVELSESKEINSYYVYALMKCRVTKPSMTLRNARLTDAAQELLQEQGWDDFASSYGWEYVEGYVPGGSYFGLIEIQTTTEHEQRDVKAKLGGYYGPFSASVDFQHTMEDIQRRTAINVTVARSGGAGIVETSLEEMLRAAREFPLTVEASPVEMTALTASYLNTVPLPALDPPNLPALQEDTIADLGRHYIRLRDYRANLEFILGRPMAEFDQFRMLEGTQLTEQRAAFRRILDKVMDEIDEVSRRAKACARNSDQCETYSPDVEYVDLPTIGGELLNFRQMEEKMTAMEQTLRSHGLLGGSPAIFDDQVRTAGDVIVGAGGKNKRLQTRHIDGKAGDSDAPERLVLNWDNGHTVQVGGHLRSNLEVHGSIHAVEGDLSGAYTRTWDLLAGGGVYIGTRPAPHGGPAADIQNSGNIGCHDIFPRGGVYVGGDRNDLHTAPARMNANGTIVGKKKEFVIDHPLEPDTAKLVHACLEGPEAGVYYRGEAVLDGKSACVELPRYFEALTRPEGRTVLVTPVFEDLEHDITSLAASPVMDNHFFVRAASGKSASQRFYWEVKGIRADVDPLNVEIPKGNQEE